MPAERVDTVNAEDYFGKPISRYTRKQALEDGFQIDVSDTAREAGLRFPVFITRAVFETWVAPDHVKDENETARLRDILWMTRCAIKAAAPGACAIRVQLRLLNRRVDLRAVCAALDIDEPQPAITIMLPDED